MPCLEKKIAKTYWAIVEEKPPFEKRRVSQLAKEKSRKKQIKGI